MPANSVVKFPELEEKVLKYWSEAEIFEKYLAKNKKSKKRFSFLDGPITANNPMGVHHAWGRTYKDIWQKYFNLKGYKQRFQNGFDCQGLWVEVEVEKELGLKNKKDIENLVPGDKKASIAKFVSLCKERVLKYSRIQTEQSIRLGYFMDWDNSYYTMSEENNYMIWHFLKKCHEKGWIYKGPDSVPWCPRCQTAISQHEMLTEDYKELTHETVFIKLPLIDFKIANTFLVIWTTTPWTVPANVAVGVNRKFTYDIFENRDSQERIIFAGKDENGQKPLRSYQGREVGIAEYIFKTAKKEGFEKIKEIAAKELIGLKYSAPFDDLPAVISAQKENPQTFHTVVDASDIVTAQEGTGLLHVAPGAGKEDFDLGKKEKLPVISVIADDASYLDTLGIFSRKNAKKHPEIIIDYLRSLKNGRFLLGSFNFTHRYPACWRCKTELVWKVAEEWYIAMDRSSPTLREQMMEVAKMIDWHPVWGLERELDWLSNMHDWLISKKNRYWGLALPIFECLKCGHFEVIGGKDELKKKTVEGWSAFEGQTPHKPFIDEIKIKCPKCQNKVSRIDDVGNVWLDAGIVPFSTYVDPKNRKLSYISDKIYWREWFPADFITESFPGQFKNWFYSMIAMATVLENKNPFKTVLGYASVLGEDGRPMHKSWGNAIDFHQGASDIGVDVMRWMFAKQDPEANILFGFKKADETRRKFHLLFWNIYNFFLVYSKTDKFNAKKHQLNRQNILDAWVLSYLEKTMATADKALEKFDASTAANTLENFVTDLSQWYVRRSRERVGPAAEETQNKYACHAVLHHILTKLCIVLSPFLPFLTEEIYRNLTGKKSVHLENWPEESAEKINEKLLEQMVKARSLVEKGHAFRKEKMIKVRKPLLKLDLQAEGDFADLPEAMWDEVLSELNVKNITVNGKIRYPKKEIKVSDSLLEKEGQARELVRKVQLMRKEANLGVADRIRLTLSQWPPEFNDYLKKETLAVAIEKGQQEKVTKV